MLLHVTCGIAKLTEPATNESMFSVQLRIDNIDTVEHARAVSDWVTGLISDHVSDLGPGANIVLDWEDASKEGKPMIDWKHYVMARQEGRPVWAWVGWITGRPQYNIQPKGEGWALTWVAVEPKVEIAAASGDDALDELKQRADQHRAEFTGGLCP